RASMRSRSEIPCSAASSRLSRGAASRSSSRTEATSAVVRRGCWAFSAVIRSSRLTLHTFRIASRKCWRGVLLIAGVAPLRCCTEYVQLSQDAFPAETRHYEQWVNLLGREYRPDSESAEQQCLRCLRAIDLEFLRESSGKCSLSDLPSLATDDSRVDLERVVG